MPAFSATKLAGTAPPRQGRHVADGPPRPSVGWMLLVEGAAWGATKRKIRNNNQNLTFAALSARKSLQARNSRHEDY